jgi:hypothetical protein
MTPSDDSLRNFYLKDDYCSYRRPGWKQLLCAWFIILTVATLFRITDLISSNRTAPFAPATHLAQTAVDERTGEVERWERGVPRQWTMTVPSTRKFIMVSRIDQ